VSVNAAGKGGPDQDGAEEMTECAVGYQGEEKLVISGAR